MRKTVRSGYVALITVVLVMSTVVAVGITVALLSANGLVLSLLNSHGTRAYYVADSCANESLLQLKRTGLSYVGNHTITVGTNNCTITVTNTSGNIVDVEIDANYSTTVYRHVTLTVDTSPFAVQDWKEVD